MNQLKHIAFIMDGNRRWAIQQGMMKTEGHQYGLKNMKDILKHSKQQGILQISFWVLAKKNIEERSAFEKEVLFRLIDAKIQDFAQDCLEEHIRIEYIGDLNLLPPSSKKSLLQAQELTKQETEAVVVIGIGYGGKDEIIRATKKIIAEGIDPESLDEATFTRYLDSGKYNPPDLIVRTGGDSRHSGYYLFQSEYSEYAYTQTLWPDFTRDELDTIIQTYEQSKRNFGK